MPFYFKIRICWIILILFCIGSIWWSDVFREFTPKFTTAIRKGSETSLRNEYSVELTNDRKLEGRLIARRKMVEDYCKKHKTSHPLLGTNLRYFLVFRKRKIIYCYIPKVASTQWKKELLVLKEEDEQVYRHANVTVANNNLNYYPAQEAEKMLKNYFTFLFVRDPLERILSAYKDKLLKDNKIFRRAIGRKIIAQFRSNATRHALETGSDVTFPEFMNFLLKTRAYTYDEHWKPFDNLCHPCTINYDFIGKYEDLAEEAPYLVKKAGIDDRVSFPPFRASNTTADLLHYYSQIPTTKILQLAKIYESDYKMFNFPFPGKLAKLFDSKHS
ncbi:carbohydrate sulfotransferase 11-like [Stylophora pistillata]|uniref:carbohydrate sulfotransferase 11-like n=1 Tax=Stylophora pistillata TaxID=50429 RepID=UPI000C055075|nr:carbohydrate sulfotransferase 11-like [Stylophora pistillata]